MLPYMPYIAYMDPVGKLCSITKSTIVRYVTHLILCVCYSNKTPNGGISPNICQFVMTCGSLLLVREFENG